MQCKATANRTGKRCERRVVGATVCIMHGGTAPQVKAARQRRLAFDAALAADPRRSADEVLLDVLHSADHLMRRARAEVDAGEANLDTIRQLVELEERAGKWADKAHDAGVHERVAGQRPVPLTAVEIPEQVSNAVVAAVSAVLSALHIADVDDWVRQQTAVALRSTGRGETPQVPPPPVYLLRRIVRRLSRQLGLPELPLNMSDVPPKPPRAITSR